MIVEMCVGHALRSFAVLTVTLRYEFCADHGNRKQS